VSPPRRGAPKGRGGGGGGRSRAPGGTGRGGPARGRTSGNRTGGPDRGQRPTKGRGVGGEQVEGRQAVRELLLAGTRRVHEVVMASDLDPAPILDDIRDLAGEERVPIREASRTKLAALALTDAPQGVVAMASPLREADLVDLARPDVDGRPPFLLGVDGVTDPGNLGALFRSAEGAGVTGVVLPRHRAVHITATVAKAAQGAVEHLPIALVSGLPSGVTQLKERGVWSVGLDADGTDSVFDLTLATEPLILVLGAEGRGLSRLVRQRCDVLASIPQQGRLSSLNVSAAAAVACFEVLRQRQAAAPPPEA
jgi:23S rRNA (guanosine2251-2'-O)-methyltransferase